MPKPVPLTFPHDPLAELLSLYRHSKHSQLSLVYLGPRFDTTYSAWKVLGVEFPYNYLGIQRVILTDR